MNVKIYTIGLLIALSLSLSGFAQITLEAEDLPQLGDIIEFTEVVYQDLEEGPSGADIFWDFSSLTTLQVTDLEYSDVSLFPEAAQYANCESVFNSTVYDLVGILMETVSPGLGDPNGQAFLNDEYDGHLYIEGLVTGVTVPGSPFSYVNADVDNPIIHLTHLDYGETAGGTSVAYVPVSFNGINGVAELSVVRSVEADAWGTVVTPLGTFEVIRHKEITEAWAKAGIMIGGVFNEVNGVVPDTTAYQETYHYMSKELHHPVLTVRKSLFPITVQYVGYASGANFPFAVGIEDNFTKNLIQVYPNPASNQIYIDEAQNIKRIEILSVEQRHVLTLSNPDVAIDVSALANGLYFIKSILQNDEVSYGQFVKQ